MKLDAEVDAEDLRSRNLILFGDPGSNAWIAKVLPSLPVDWSRETVRFGGVTYDAREHLVAMIHPNPLDETHSHYVVLNSGHTFRETELAKLNYLLFPRWGDWAVLKIDAAQESPHESVVRAGYFNERWLESSSYPHGP